jgi:2-polyprenyl-6-methoxyphenol hydroxylase-like FAD-dependent oxidoreductase
VILIVGAGPTGLSLAIELARRGVPFRLIDKATARSDKSRALAVQARSLELMRPWGVADELVARGQRAFAAQIFVEKKASASVELSDIGVDDTPYPHLLFTSQADTERALDAALARLGGTIERGVEFGDLREWPEGVDATMVYKDGRLETARFDWVVGCDGAHSEVRSCAGLEFAGAAYEQDFLLADLAIEWDAPEQLFFFLGKGRNAVVLPLRDGQKRIIGMSGAPPPPGAGAEPTLDEIAALLGEVCPFAFRLGKPTWTARFRLHHRGVSRYRAGRLFVAGDAAHIHSPAGGQGMNTGIQDAINLGWKLALVARGEAPPALLDTYDEERRPVGERLLQFTDRLFSLVTSPNPIVVWARNRLVPLFAPRLMKTPARRKLAFRFVSQLGITYAGSSLVGDCGERAPDALVDGVNHLVDAFNSPLHHLVVFGAGAEFLRAAIARFAPHLDGIVVDDATARRRYGVDGDGWALVRPDQYIAARAQSYDDTTLDAYFGARIGISSSKRSM